jgi:hypothetical protein
MSPLKIRNKVPVPRKIQTEVPEISIPIFFLVCSSHTKAKSMIAMRNMMHATTSMIVGG